MMIDLEVNLTKFKYGDIVGIKSNGEWENGFYDGLRGKIITYEKRDDSPYYGIDKLEHIVIPEKYLTKGE